MKKLIFERDKEKNKKRNQSIIIGILLFIMLLSTLGYAFQSIISNNNNTVTRAYKGVQFIQQNGLWDSNFNGINIIFRYFPSDINNTNFIINSVGNYYNKTLYIYSDSLEAENEIRNNLVNFVGNIQNACPENSNCIKFPIKTCDNNFIIIQKGNQSQVNQNNNCVYIQGENSQLIKLTDGFLFKLFGII